MSGKNNIFTKFKSSVNCCLTGVSLLAHATSSMTIASMTIASLTGAQVCHDKHGCNCSSAVQAFVCMAWDCPAANNFLWHALFVWKAGAFLAALELINRIALPLKHRPFV